MICTDRDEQMFQTLGSYGVLSTEQVARMFFPNVATTTVRRRLRLLEAAELIYRIHGLDNGGVTWALTKSTADRIGCMFPIRHFNRNSIGHDVALSEVRNVLETTGICQSWVPEHVLKTQASMNRFRSNDEKPFVPDAILSVRQKNETRVIALEVELSAKNRKRYENILSRYQEKKTLWAVWYLVGGVGIGKLLEKVWRDINRGQRNDLLIWSVLPDFLKDPLNSHVRAEYFSYPLRELINHKSGALPGAPTGISTEKGITTKILADVF